MRTTSNPKGRWTACLVLGAVLLARPLASLARPPAGEKSSTQAVPPNVNVGQQKVAQPPKDPSGLGPPTTGAPAPTVQLKPGEVPAIEFDTPVYDFGRVKSGDDIQHDFWFHDTGNGSLEILQVKPSCGCTTANNYDRIVEPGQSGRIPVKVSTGHGTGPISKSITVVTNVSGAASTISLQIKGNCGRSSRPRRTAPSSETSPPPRPRKARWSAS